MYVLKTKVHSDAAADTNYKLAWSLLDAKINNKREVLRIHFENLMDAPNAGELAVLSAFPLIRQYSHFQCVICRKMDSFKTEEERSQQICCQWWMVWSKLKGANVLGSKKILQIAAQTRRNMLRNLAVVTHCDIFLPLDFTSQKLAKVSDVRSRETVTWCANRKSESFWLC